MTIDTDKSALLDERYEDELRGKYSASQKDDMLKKGHAILSPATGKASFPIGDHDDIKKAVKAVGLGAAPDEAIRKHIIKNAARVGASHLIPPSWNKSDGTVKKTRTRNANRVVTEYTEAEQRFSSETGEVRTGGGNKDQVSVTGAYPIVFNRKGFVVDNQGPRGGFDEIILPTAMRGLEDSKIALYVNHQSSQIPLASTWNGTLRWTTDAHGVQMSATLDDTRSDCHDAAAAVMSGILNKMSFAFNKGPNFRDSWSPDFETRTIHQFGGVSDFSWVQSPAYPDSSAGEVAQRSLARAWRTLDLGETELRSGKTLSKATVGQLTNAVGSILTAGHHIGQAHEHVTKLLTSNGINLESLPNNIGDATTGGGGNNQGFDIAPGIQDGTGSRGRPTQVELDLIAIYLEHLDDERRESERKVSEVRNMIREMRLQ